MHMISLSYLLAHIEASITPIKQGNTIREIGDELLEALTGQIKRLLEGQ